MKDIGLVIPTHNGDATVKRRLLTAWDSPSSVYEAELADGTVINIHENVVKAVMAGTYVLEAKKVRGPRKVSTKKERALKHVEACKKARMSRGETIKVIAQKLRVSRATAQSYYYSVK